MTDAPEVIESPADRRLRCMAVDAKALNRKAREVGGGSPQTAEIPLPRLREHTPHLAAALRFIIETWADCQGAIPQPLSLAVMAGKDAWNAASAKE